MIIDSQYEIIKCIFIIYFSFNLQFFNKIKNKVLLNIKNTLQKTTDILNLKVSFQENTWSNISSSEPSINNVLNAIQSDKYKHQITDLRTNLEIDNTAYYNDNKKRLPAVTFSATFTANRIKANVKNYNNLIVIDIDKLSTQEMVTCYNQLLNDDYVFSFWRSPSNKGYKGLVHLLYIDIPGDIDLETKHKSAFKKLSTYFQEKYAIELDKSGSDISRLCFLSYDKNLVIKEKAISFQITNADINFSPKKVGNHAHKIKSTGSRDALFNPLGRNNQYNRKLISDIIRYLTNKNLSITYSYTQWCKVAMAIANSFTYDTGLKYFLKLCKLDVSKYNETHCVNFLNNCYETKNGSVTFASIIHLANEKGYKTKQQKIKEEVPKVET